MRERHWGEPDTTDVQADKIVSATTITPVAALVRRGTLILTRHDVEQVIGSACSEGALGVPRGRLRRRDGTSGSRDHAGAFS